MKKVYFWLIGIFIIGINFGNDLSHAYYWWMLFDSASLGLACGCAIEAVRKDEARKLDEEMKKTE